MRWPFAVALFATLVAVGAWFGVPYAKDRYQAWQDSRDERQAAAEFRLAQPAADALAGTPLPAGIENCPDLPNGSLAKDHYFCWRATTDIEHTTVNIATHLRTLGADNVSPRCRRHNWTGHAAVLNLLCQVTADIDGQRFFANIGPELDKVSDSFTSSAVTVQGGVGPADEALLLPLQSATPLPFPSDQPKLPTPK